MAFRALLALVGVALLALAAPNVGPVIAAAGTGGTPGVFTGSRLDCVRHPGHQQCRWYGDFRSLDGRVRRTSVFLYGGTSPTPAVGASVPARDIGRTNRVYGTAPSHEWVLTALLLVAGAGLLAAAVWPASRRRRSRASAGPSSGRRLPGRTLPDLQPRGQPDRVGRALGDGEPVE